MANLGFSACSLSVFLAAVAGQAPCAKGVLIEKELLATNQVDVFGRTHTAMGAADLSLTLGGTLVVSNIGSSGLDGVTFRLGDTRGHSMSMDMGDMSALAPGAKVEMFLPYRFGEQTVFIQEQGGGSARFGVGGSYPPPQRLTVTVLDNGVPVDSRCVDPSAFPSLVTGDMGSDPISGQGLSLSFEQVEWDYVATLTLPTDSSLTIPGSPAGAVMGDQIRVSMEGLPPGEAPSGDIRVLCTDLAQDLEIRSEDLILPGVSRLDLPGVTNAPYDITVGKRVSALGGALLEGMAEAQACQSHPKSWFFSTRLLDTTRALSVDNLGSSGLDGVSISYGGGTPCGAGFFQCPDGNCVAVAANCASVAADRVVYIGGKDPANPDFLDMDSDDDGITFSATGTSGGSSGVNFGTVSLYNLPGEGNELELSADFSSIGSDLVSVAVYSGGAFVGEFQQIVQPGVSLATILPSPDGIDIDSCGKFVGGPPFGPPCFFFTTAGEFTLFGGGQLLAGDECRVLAAGNPTPIDFIDTFDITGTNLEPFDLRLESDADVWPATGVATVAQGSRLYAAGDAAVSSGANDSLVVSNIGSSGLDGVRIPMDDATAVRYEIAAGGEFTVDSFFDISYNAVDNGCPSCQPVRASGVRLTATTPDVILVTGDGLDPTALARVVLRDAAGYEVGSFEMEQNESVVVTEPNGQSVGLSKADSKRGVDPDGSTTLVAHICHLVAGPGGGTGSGMGVLSPAGVSYQGVSSIEVGVPVATAALPCCRGHVTVLKSHDPGGTSGTTGDMEIVSLSKKGYDYYMASSGLARTQIEVCDSSTGSDQFLTVANLGSSGEDGVSFDLSSETCRAGCPCDDDCDGDIDDVWLNVASLDGIGGPGGLKIKVVAKKEPTGGGTSEMTFTFECAGELVAGSPVTTVGVSLNDDDLTPYEYRIRTTVTDDTGRSLAVEDENLYPSVLNNSPDLLSIDAGALDGRFTASPTFGPSPTGRWWVNQKMNEALVEPATITMLRSGQVVPNASGYEVEIIPIQATPVEIEEITGLEVLLAAPAGELGSFEITDFGLSRVVEPACPADVNGDGIIDNGDIGQFITLFLAQDPSVDFSGDGVVDNGDIGAFITAFLGGC